MIGVFVLAALFASAVVLYVVVGARRNRARSMDRTSASAALFADRRQELVAEGRVQALDTSTLAELEEELALDLIESEAQPVASQGESGDASPQDAPLRIVALTGAGLAVVALGLYAIWGEPHASALVRAGDVLVSDGVDRAALASAEKALSARAGRNPEDVDTWFFLGHARMRLADYRGAEIAFAKLRDLAGPNEEADAAWAQASYLAEDGLTETARQVVERVLAARPDHPAMLEMLAMDAMRRGAFARASGYLARATGQPLPESRRALLENLMTVARSQLDPARPLIEVSVSIEGDTRRPWLIVFARPIGGGMPLAVVRVRARASQTVLLDDTVGIGGATRLSDGGVVEVVARLSNTGNAVASSDDLEVSAQPVDPGAQPRVELTFAPDAIPASATATVDVSLDAAFDVAPAAMVFVIARDAAQPGPPLAVKRIVAGDLPARVALTDADAMLAGRGLQGVETLELVARVALGGSTTAMAGDLESPIWVGSLSAEPVHLHIDRRLP
ncbi:MAG: c-type cytochrome biogenesis protein CcmI [Gammaproteobacteria bacterium]|nr:c-type cytochrome biogenesis protein CcmI [Gammaproteobacteria bacterium]